MELLILLALIQIKHCYVDFVSQSAEQIRCKGIWLNPVGISHSLEHVYCSLIALLIFSLYIPVDPFDILIVAFVEGALHYIIDYVKIRYGSKDISNSKFWTQFGLDQLAHQVTYLAMVAYLIS